MPLSGIIKLALPLLFSAAVFKVCPLTPANKKFWKKELWLRQKSGY
jgi:hypothetical protein